MIKFKGGELDKSYGAYVLENSSKLNRAIFGTVGADGKLEGGVGEDASEAEIIANYDKLGGFISKDGDKVRIGSFYDFERKSPRPKPEVVLTFRDLEGKVVEIEEGKEVPKAVEAAKLSAKIKAKEAKKAAKKSKKKNK